MFLCIWSLGHGTFFGACFIESWWEFLGFVPLCLCAFVTLGVWSFEPFVPLAWDGFSLLTRIWWRFSGNLLGGAFLGFSYIFSMYLCLLHVTDGTCVPWSSFGANSLWWHVLFTCVLVLAYFPLRSFHCIISLRIFWNVSLRDRGVRTGCMTWE